VASLYMNYGRQIFASERQLSAWRLSWRLSEIGRTETFERRHIRCNDRLQFLKNIHQLKSPYPDLLQLKSPYPDLLQRRLEATVRTEPCMTGGRYLVRSSALGASDRNDTPPLSLFTDRSVPNNDKPAEEVGCISLFG
jgi:hypothetical protein